MKKKLLFKIWKFPQVSETFVVNQVILAIKLGYDVNILVDEFCRDEVIYYQDIFTEYNLEQRLIKKDLKIPKRKFFKLLKLSFCLLRKPILSIYTWKYYRGSHKLNLNVLYELVFFTGYRRWDIIHIQYGTNKYPVDIFKKIGFLKSKLIVSFHGHDLHFPINGIIPKKDYYDILFETSDKLVCNTAYLENKLREVGAPQFKIEKVPVGVNTNYFKPLITKISRKQFQLVTIGRLDTLKGQKYGIKTVQLLIKQNYDINYVIAGSGPSENYLKNLVKKLGLSKYIHFSGKVNQQEIRTILQSSDVFLMTSITNESGMQESQGLVVAEAQACSLPVVAFNSGGIKHTLIDGKTGFLCQEKDLKDFSSKVATLISNETLRLKMGKNGRLFINEHFSHEILLDKWKFIYD